jgi:hypothetical protein
MEDHTSYSKGVSEWMGTEEDEQGQQLRKHGWRGFGKVADAPPAQPETSGRKEIRLKQRTDRVLWQRMIGLEAAPFK